MKIKILTTLSALLLCSSVAQSQIPTDEQLRFYAAQMLMVGFKGNSVDANSDAARYIRDLKVGSIVLFDIDLTGSAKIGSRNITSREQLARLTFSRLPPIRSLLPPTKKADGCSASNLPMALNLCPPLRISAR